MENYYHILGVSPIASQEEIQKRYRFLVKAYHPDRFSRDDEKLQAEEDMKRINSAYSILSNVTKRADYDRLLSQEEEIGKDSGGESEEKSRKISVAMNYIQQVMETWAGKIKDYRPDRKQEELIQSIKSQIITQMKLSGIRLGSARYIEITAKIDKNIGLIAVVNLSIGAEEAKAKGLPNEVDQNILIFLAINDVQDISNSLIERNLRTGKLRINQAQTIAEELESLYLALCYAFQLSGRKLVEIETSYSAYDATLFSQRSKSLVCDACFSHTQTENLVFRQNIGVFFRRYYRKIEGNLCADCAESYFWKFTTLNLLVGWWGVISFCITPFLIIMNIYNYLRAWKLRKYSTNLSSIALGWKLLSLASFIMILIMLIPTLSQPSSSQVQRGPVTSAPTMKPKPTTVLSYQTSTPVVNPAKTSSPIYYQPTSSEAGCLLWSQVTAADQGEHLCVYGIVQETYFVEDMFYMKFGPYQNDFRMIVLNGYYFKGIEGNCVMAEGIIKTYNKMPYIEVGENLYKCE